MREIKFRGRDLNGHFVYGGISRNGRAIVLDDYGSGAWVDPASIRQLVGHDANGNEVYEGDTVLRYDSEAEFREAPENGVLREVALYTQVNPDLESYYCIALKEEEASMWHKRTKVAQ